MKEVSITFWEVTPEEALRLPKGTQLIEYDPMTKRLNVKRSDHCLYDFSCVYLLATDPSEFTKAADGKNQNGGKPVRKGEKYE